MRRLHLENLTQSHFSMDESAIKVLELLELTDRGADTRKNRISRIVVEGYDTWLPKEDVEAALREHFASCGKLIHAFIPIDVETGILNRFALIYVRGDEEEKALRLDGSDMGGRTVSTKAYSFNETYLDPELAPLRKALQNKWQRTIKVTGFDTSLPKDDIMNALMKHFSLRRAVVRDDESGGGGLRSEAFVTVTGEDAIEKALELSGRTVGGLNIVVTEVLPVPKKSLWGYTPLRNLALMTEEQKAQGLYYCLN